MSGADFDAFQKNPLTMAALGAIIMFGWNTWNEGRRSGETYATVAFVNAGREQDRGYEREQRETLAAALKDYSNRNHDDMEKKFLASKAELSLQIEGLSNGIKLMDQRLSLVLDGRGKK